MWVGILVELYMCNLFVTFPVCHVSMEVMGGVSITRLWTKCLEENLSVPSSASSVDRWALG